MTVLSGSITPQMGGAIRVPIDNKNHQKAIVFCWSDQNKEIANDQKQIQVKSINHQTIVKKLQEKIRLYKAEMLTSIGETEAYSEWVSEMPELESDVKLHYQQTRDHAKLILGKVKGFERLLAQYETRL